MPNIVKVLKEEIARISRKEVKAAVIRVHRPTVKLRKHVAALKRRMAAVEKENRRLQAVVGRLEAAPLAVPAASAPRARITAKGLRSLRRKLRLSQAEFARLVGVTDQSVYNWERKQGAVRLRDKTRDAVLAVRPLGAREARERLADVQRPRKRRGPAAARRRGKKRR